MNSKRAPPQTRLSWSEMTGVLRNSVLLAGAAMVAAYPMFSYQYRHLPALLLSLDLPAEQLQRYTLRQCIILFLIGFLCALVGFMYSRRLRLPAFGEAADLWRWLLPGLGAGLLLTPLAYAVADRPLMAQLPAVFPHPWPWALADMLGSALTQEVLARFGLLTIAVYFLDRWGFRGHPWPALLLIAAFGALGAYLFLGKFGLLERLLPGQILAVAGLAFALQWFYCEVYLRLGFLATVSIHVGLNVKLLVYALWPA